VGRGDWSGRGDFFSKRCCVRLAEKNRQEI